MVFEAAFEGLGLAEAELPAEVGFEGFAAEDPEEAVGAPPVVDAAGADPLEGLAKRVRCIGREYWQTRSPASRRGGRATCPALGDGSVDTTVVPK